MRDTQAAGKVEQSIEFIIIVYQPLKCIVYRIAGQAIGRSNPSPSPLINDILTSYTLWTKDVIHTFSSINQLSK